MTQGHRLRKPFRVGVLRGSSQQFKPMATIGLAADGGVWVAPADVRGYSWLYGSLRSRIAPDPGDHVQTNQRPKLHYHRSGIVSVTLTGAPLQSRSVKYPSIPLLKRAQLLSIVSVRSWELATHPGEPRRGDILAMEPKWPQIVAFSLSLVAIPTNVDHRADLAELAPIGLLAGDPRRFVVDMSAHGVRALVVGLVTADHEPREDLEPGTSVVALPWTDDHTGETAEAFGLWTSSMRNPIIRMESAEDVLTDQDVTNAREGNIVVRPLSDSVRDLQERGWA